MIVIYLIIGIIILPIITYPIVDLICYLFKINRCEKSNLWHKQHSYKPYSKPLTWGELSYNVDLMSKGYLGNSYLLHSKSNPIIGQQCEFCKNIKYNVKN